MSLARVEERPPRPLFFAIGHDVHDAGPSDSSGSDLAAADRNLDKVRSSMARDVVRRGTHHFREYFESQGTLLGRRLVSSTANAALGARWPVADVKTTKVALGQLPGRCCRMGRGFRVAGAAGLRRARASSRFWKNSSWRPRRDEYVLSTSPGKSGGEGWGLRGGCFCVRGNAEQPPHPDPSPP